MNAISLLTGNITFNDVAHGSSFSDWFASQLSSFTPINVAIALVAALVAGLIISTVYKKTFRGVLYSPSFTMTLILLCLVTTPVVMAIGSNVALSMGMVGALSIVRFRTAVKDPLDTAYMFWAITMGILLGSNAYIIAIVALLGISIILLVLSYVRLRNPNGYLLVLHYDEFAQADIENELKRSVRFYRMRSKTVTRSGAEMTVEIRLDHRANLVSQMLDINGVHDATLVACQTEAGA
ncbi:MAG: DUF4956 domain-containing protein [Clostridia bacterium]|nr:DUF4956 domain-containing protein [Clostridiales bacterium]MBQ2977589.1 DUF4956 domain-containing protein [Clostridia bacterium]MBQ6804884.1 DUF4956 domain-containing protein [Clostridia bacterium]